VEDLPEPFLALDDPDRVLAPLLVEALEVQGEGHVVRALLEQGPLALVRLPGRVGLDLEQPVLPAVYADDDLDHGRVRPGQRVGPGQEPHGPVSSRLADPLGGVPGHDGRSLATGDLAEEVATDTEQRLVRAGPVDVRAVPVAGGEPSRDVRLITLSGPDTLRHDDSPQNSEKLYSRESSKNLCRSVVPGGRDAPGK